MNVTVHSITARTIATTTTTTTTDISAMLMGGSDPDEGRVSSRIFCLGGKIVCKDQLCVKHAKFLSPFLSINHQCTKKHKARVFIIRYCINCQNFLGGKLEGLGGKLPPCTPQ